MQAKSYPANEKNHGGRQAAYRTLATVTRRQPWIVQGSVVEVPPGQKSSAKASTTYMWTRKVHAKTVTVALSREQFLAFREAIEANRLLEQALRQVREVSQTALLQTLPGVSKRHTNRLQPTVAVVSKDGPM